MEWELSYSVPQETTECVSLEVVRVTSILIKLKVCSENTFNEVKITFKGTKCCYRQCLPYLTNVDLNWSMVLCRNDSVCNRAKIQMNWWLDVLHLNYNAYNCIKYWDRLLVLLNMFFKCPIEWSTFNRKIQDEGYEANSIVACLQPFQSKPSCINTQSLI